MVIKKTVIKKKLVIKKKPVAKKKAILKKKVARKVKPTKRLVKKLIASVSKLESRLTRPKAKKPVKLGKVIHYYNQIKVGIVKLSAPLSEGQKIQFRGVTTDFFQVAKSIQINHAQVKKTKKGQIIGLKVSKRVRQGDEMFVA